MGTVISTSFVVKNRQESRYRVDIEMFETKNVAVASYARVDLPTRNLVDSFTYQCSSSVFLSLQIHNASASQDRVIKRPRVIGLRLGMSEY